MIIRKVITFNNADDADLVRHLESMPKGAMSRYVRDLIRADLRRESLEDMVRRIVAEELKKGGKGDDVARALRGMFNEV
jgi:hypothetical protein